MKRRQPIYIGRQPVGAVALRIVAERCDIEGCVGKQVLELTGEFRGLLPVCLTHASAIEIIGGARVIPRVARFEEVINTRLRRVPPARVVIGSSRLWRRSRRGYLRTRHAGNRKERDESEHELQSTPAINGPTTAVALTLGT